MSNLTIAHNTYHSFPGLSTKKTAIFQIQTFCNFAKMSQFKDFFGGLNIQITNSYLLTCDLTIARSGYAYSS